MSTDTAAGVAGSAPRSVVIDGYRDTCREYGNLLAAMYSAEGLCSQIQDDQRAAGETPWSREQIADALLPELRHVMDRDNL